MNSSKHSQLAMVGLLRRLFRHTSRHRHYQFSFFLILTLISSVAEVISLGALVPFIGVLTQPAKVYDYLANKGVIHYLGFNSPQELILPLAAGFALAAIFAGGLRLFLSWVSIKLTNGIGTDLSTEVYRRTLYQPYRVHIARSSGEIISGITQKVGAATGMLLALMNVVTSSILFGAILVTLILIDPLIASMALVSFGTCYIIIAWKTKATLYKNSQHISIELNNVMKSLQEGLGGIREVLLDGTQEAYSEIYRKANMKLQNAGGENNFINQAPRFVMEALGMVMIALFAYSLSRTPGGVQGALPTLGALALGAQRLLPLLQILYGNWSVLIGSHASLEVILDLLEQPLPEDVNTPLPKALPLKDAIVFQDVSFRYSPDSPMVLQGINLTIPKGSRIGFIGSTGSGKSTALDLLMYLLEPTNGCLLVDNKKLTLDMKRAWQRNIAHVPQSIYLADATIAENIAFGVALEEIDMNRVREAARKAQIADFVESSPLEYKAMVGERGVRLSGGQRQRIGIARALYKDAKVLIFDEATSALDSETEKAVMESIEKLHGELTVLIIAHRLSTLSGCDFIVRLEKGKLLDQGSYENMIRSHSIQ